MAESADAKIGEPLQASLGPVYLVSCQFNDPKLPEEVLQPVPEEYALQTGVALHRPSRDQLAVALRVEMRVEGGYSVGVSYAAELTAAQGISDDDLDFTFRHYASRVIPALLFPYIRELVQALTSRSRGEPLTLPFLALPIMEPEALNIPPVEEGEATAAPR